MKHSRKHKHDSYAFGDDPVIEDGGSVRVPMMICDSNKLLGHRPGWIAPLSEEQIAARQEMIDAATGAWRGSGARNLALDSRRKPDPDDDPDEDDEDQDIADARRFASREAYVAGLRDAWRGNRTATGQFRTGTVHRDGAEPDNSSSAEAMRAHLRGSDPKTAAEIKEQAYQEYSASVSRAWMNPTPQNAIGTGRTDPSAASRIERARQQALGK
jgi:hypothetical protein